MVVIMTGFYPDHQGYGAPTGADEATRTGGHPPARRRVQGHGSAWPSRPEIFDQLLTPVEAAQYLRLDEAGHTPRAALRTLTYWRQRGELKATKYARRVWYRKDELDRFLEVKTES